MPILWFYDDSRAYRWNPALYALYDDFARKECRKASHTGYQEKLRHAKKKEKVVSEVKTGKCEVCERSMFGEGFCLSCRKLQYTLVEMDIIPEAATMSRHIAILKEHVSIFKTLDSGLRIEIIVAHIAIIKEYLSLFGKDIFAMDTLQNINLLERIARRWLRKMEEE